jgi:hypothetical protein
MKKNIKEKIFELKITDDMEDESGIDSISLVDTPAIEVNWVSFSKEKEHEFHIPDGEDDNYLDKLTPYGEDEKSLFEEGFEIASIEYQHKDDFIYSFPNRESELDTDLFRVRYKYMLNPQAGGQPITATTRKFCSDLIRKNLVFRLEDMLNQQNDQGSSFADWRGGYNCRHIFARIIYKKKGEIKDNARGKREEGYDILGGSQNDTRTSNPSFSKEKLGYDNNLPKYVDEVSGDTISKSIVFESYNDYPEAAKNNACKVLRWRDEHGDEVKGMTQVGWTRANQLCKGENISEETIARMASFARHKENAEVSAEFKSTPWKDRGYVAWLGWGGTTGIEWAQRKLESIRNDMSSLKFQTDEEKRMVVGPAMIPDMNIFRKDIFGNPYYVFFSEETISLIAEKYMKNKYLDNNDLMHNGQAVSDVYVVESWIIEDPETDKSKKYGYNLPIGTWMVAMKCAKTPKGDEVWNKIKSKELNGFSVSGYFIEEAANFRDELFLQKVVEILKNIK